jgi:hypothetical protein
VKGTARTRAQWLPVLLVVLSVFPAALLAFLPQQTQYSEIVWSPETADESGNLVLGRGWPAELDVYSTCSHVRAEDSDLLLDAGGFSLVKAENVVTGLGVTVELPPGDCPLRLSFRAADSRVTLEAGSNAAAAELDVSQFPLITRLVVPEGPVSTVDSVRIKTRPTAVAVSGTRWVLALTSVLLAVCALIVLVRRGTSRIGRDDELSVKTRKRLGKRLHLADALVLLILGALSLSFSRVYDDGWVLSRANVFGVNGVFSDVYNYPETWYPTRHLNEFVIFAFDAMGGTLPILGIWNVGLLFFAWVIFRRWILPLVSADRPGRVWVSAAVFLAFCSAWLITLRPGPLIVFLSAVAWASVLIFYRTSSPTAIFLGLSSSAIALANSLTGWTVVVGPGLVLVFLVLQRLKSKKVGLLTAGVAGVGAATLSATVVFSVLNMKLILEGISEVQVNTQAQLGFWDEFQRYLVDIPAQGTSFGRLASLVFLLLFIVVASVWLAGTPRIQRLAWGVSGLAILGLALTSSKWIGHVGSLAIPATVLAVIGLFARQRVSAAGWLPRYTLVLPGLVLIVGWSAVAASGLAHPLPNRSWAEFLELMGPKSQSNIWLVALAGAVALGLWADLGRSGYGRLVSAGVAALVIAIPTIVTVVWPVLNAVDGGQWSQLRQNVRQIKGTDTCGALTGASIVVGADERSPVSRSVPPESQKLVRGQMPGLRGLSEGPLGSVPVWGFGGAPVGESQASRKGKTESDLLAGPIFSVRDSEQLVMWASGSAKSDAAASFSAELVYFGGAQEEIGREPLQYSDQEWKMTSLLVPTGAESVRAYIKRVDPSSSDWFAISSLSTANLGDAAEVVGESPTFAGPNNFPLYPCIDLAFPRDGYWPKTEYLISSSAYWIGARLWQLTVTDVGCNVGYADASCVKKVDYPAAEVVVTRETSDSSLL